MWPNLPNERSPERNCWAEQLLAFILSLVKKKQGVGGIQIADDHRRPLAQQFLPISETFLHIIQRTAAQ